MKSTQHGTPHAAADGEESRRTSPRRNRRRPLWLLIVVSVAALAACSRERNPARPVLPAGLPARPDIERKPAVFAQRLADAESRARSSPANVGALEELGRLYHANGFTTEAEMCWDALSARQPDEARWIYYRALLRLADSDYDGATALLNSTLKRAPDYAPAHLHLANLRLKTGELESAEQGYLRRLDLLPRDAYARLGLVRVALQQRRSEEATRLLEELLRDAPNFASAHSLYAELLAASGDETKANWHRWLGVETLRYTEPQDPWLDELEAWCYDYDRLCVLGSIASMREDRDRAKALYERALALRPDAFDAYQLLSAMYLKQGQPARARDLLDEARSRLVTPLPAAWYAYACRTHRLLGEAGEAERIAREGLVENADSAELMEALGLSLADQGGHADAVDLYQRALSRNPNDASINYNLAVALLALGRLDDTLVALDRSLALQPTFPPTLVLRGRIELGAGHLTEAERYLRPVVESHPENTEARQLLAEWHQHRAVEAEKQGDRGAAEQHYQEGLVLAPENPELLLRLGLLRVTQRKFAEAVEPLETHHRLRPNYAPGCLLLGQAYAAVGRREDARAVLQRGADSAERNGNARLATACRDALRRL